MNREIKFKGKQIDNGKWITGSETYIHDGDGIWLSDGNTDVVKVIPETVGQFTGLHDKNGTDIYEGDIIKSPLGNIVIVEFGYHEELVTHSNPKVTDSFASYGWIAKSIKRGIVGFLDNSFLAGEVIGNIYDNKELLK